MKSNKSFLKSGDVVKISISIDNSKGNTGINGGRIVLEERKAKAFPGNLCENLPSRSWAMGYLHSGIPKGKIKNWESTFMIPNYIDTCTAIGTIVANYFVIHLYTDFGCGVSEYSQAASAQLHLIIHSKDPTLMKQPRLTLP